MPIFVPGLELSARLYRDAVEPLLRRHFGDLPHTAARIGPGSEVLGFDTERSADHEWGPRLQLFLRPNDARTHAGAIVELLAERLPKTIVGWPTHFAPHEDEPATGRMAITDGPVSHRVAVSDLDTWFAHQLGFDPRGTIASQDWLATPTQTLAETTAGAVFHDGLGELEPARARLSWYPNDVWRYVLACQWQRIAQEEAFVGRTGEVGDELGSAVVAARLVRDLIRLCLLMHRRYPPYSKWLGSAFTRLPCAGPLTPALTATLAATGWRDRERHLSAAYRMVVERHNELGLTERLDPYTRPYFSRPFQVIAAERLADALVATIRDERIRTLPRIGAIDQHADSTDLLGDRAAVRHAFRFDQGRLSGGPATPRGPGE